MSWVVHPVQVTNNHNGSSHWPQTKRRWMRSGVVHYSTSQWNPLIRQGTELPSIVFQGRKRTCARHPCCANIPSCWIRAPMAWMTRAGWKPPPPASLPESGHPRSSKTVEGPPPQANQVPIPRLVNVHAFKNMYSYYVRNAALLIWEPLGL